MLNTTLKKSIFLTHGIILLLAIAGLFCSQVRPTDAKTDSSIRGVFEGITPCSNATPPVPHIPADAECEMMIWHLTLNQNPDTGEPTTYTLNSAYGMSQPNTTGIAGGGIPLDLEGRWEITDGTKTNPEAIVYQLNPDRPAETIFFIKMDDYLLHVLSPDKTLMVGNGGWSYTLNRTDTQRTTNSPASTPDPAIENATESPLPDGAATSGFFEGRTPCIDIVVEFTKLPVDPACQRIKWGLFLYQDSNTGAPTTYLFDGTQTTREGTWTISRGSAADPEGIVYRLNMEETGRFIAFLKADDNHLFLLDADLNLMVGDALLSYTLSRTG